MEKFKLEKVPATIYYVPDFVTQDEEELLIRNVYAAPKPKWTQLSNRRLQNWGGLPHPKGMVSEPIPEVVSNIVNTHYLLKLTNSSRKAKDLTIEHKWLQKVSTKISECGVFEDFSRSPNHVLVNEYLPGQGIMPHTDGPLYCPTVTTVSLGDHTLLDFYRPLDSCENSAEPHCNDDDHLETECSSASLDARWFASILLMPRSLVVVKHDMYTKYLHGIRELTVDNIDADTVANLDSCPTVNSGMQLHRTKSRLSLTVRVVPKVLQNKLFFGKK